MDIEGALKNIGDWISKETESRKYPKGELLELSESLQALKSAIARQSATSEEEEGAIDILQVIRPVWFVTKNGNPFEGTDYDWGWRCGACDYEYPLEFDDPDQPPDYNYCPHCGQKIKE